MNAPTEEVRPAQPDDIHVEHIAVEQRLQRIERAKRKETQKARDKDEAQVVVAKRKSRTLGHAAQNTARMVGGEFSAL